MIKELILASVISIIGGQTNLLSASDKPTTPSGFGVKQVEVDGPGPIVSYKERFTYRVTHVSSSYFYQDIVTFTNTNSYVGHYNFSIDVPADRFNVLNYLSLENSLPRLATVKDLVEAENLAASYTHPYSNIIILKNESVTYGVEEKRWEFRIEEVIESKHWSWWNWSNYEHVMTNYFYVYHRDFIHFIN